MKRTHIPNYRPNYLRSDNSIRKDKNVKRRKIENVDGMHKTVCFSKLDDSSHNVGHINQLPDSLLLKIFSFLDFSEIFICLYVCKRWKRIADDSNLKKDVLTEPPEKYSNLPQSIFFTRFLEEFKLQNSHEVVHPNFAKKECIKMCIESKNMKRLMLFKRSLFGITIHDLPASLKYLSMSFCIFEFNSFFSIKYDCYVAQLTCLEIRGKLFRKETRRNFSQLCLFKTLKMLSICYNYELNDEDMELMMEILPQLEVLNVEGTAISRKGLHLIFNTCFNIRELLIGECFLIEDDALDPRLRSNVPRLSYLCVRNTFISLNQLHLFLSCCPRKSLVKVDFFKKCCLGGFNSKFSECPYFYSNHSDFAHPSSLKY